MSSAAGVPARWNVPEIEYFYVEFYRRMVRDLKREIEWQRDHPQEVAGNLLCALALVVYTEVLGRVGVEQLEGRFIKNEHAFIAFLRRMGPRYEPWCDAWKKAHRRSVYDALRNGLVHRYLPKVGTKVWFYFERGEDFGLGQEAEYPLILKIRPYYDDFCRAGEELFRQLRERAPRDGLA